MDVFILRSYWIGYLVYSSGYVVDDLLQTDIYCAVLTPISENSQPLTKCYGLMARSLGGMRRECSGHGKPTHRQHRRYGELRAEGASPSLLLNELEP
jgi:hypothetical protein